jgi:L-alanine-DL-glutamate epimerase-like enolase superfamily enzyme
MKLTAATLYALNLPFVEAFRHAAKERTFSDSVIVRLRDETGCEGFGEGVPRPYVTGETPEAMLVHLAERLVRPLLGRELPELAALEDADRLIPPLALAGARADNASRCALELALVDLALKRQRRSLAVLLPPARAKIAYSGVITSGSRDKALATAKQMKVIGFRQIKVKVGYPDDAERVAELRALFGPDVSLRVDANSAWSEDEARAMLAALAPLGIAAAEQPLAHGDLAAWARLRAVSPIPLMADESLVTLEDAQRLIDARATDFFNLRISKNGGLGRTLALARLGRAAGMRLQLGAQVGETAILSAAGRHLAAHLEEVDFVEGSYGTLLLTEDVSREPVRFGHKGEAGLLTAPGLGITVRQERLRKYAARVVEVAA